MLHLAFLGDWHWLSLLWKGPQGGSIRSESFKLNFYPSPLLSNKAWEGEELGVGEILAQGPKEL